MKSSDKEHSFGCSQLQDTKMSFCSHTDLLNESMILIGEVITSRMAQNGANVALDCVCAHGIYTPALICGKWKIGCKRLKIHCSFCTAESFSPSDVTASEINFPEMSLNSFVSFFYLMSHYICAITKQSTVVHQGGTQRHLKAP